MVAREYQPARRLDAVSAKSVSLLQLDTRFPRIPGDVGCRDTFAVPMYPQVIAGAHVENIVTADPKSIDIGPFAKAIENTSGLVATSCGFLSYWQKHLQDLSPGPFVSSALIDLPYLARDFMPEELAIITFDAASLGVDHLPPDCTSYARSIIGMEEDMHLRQVISKDQTMLDPGKAGRELVGLLSAKLDRTNIKAILLECTNLPPYKAEIKEQFGVPVFDILTAIERRAEGSVRPEFL